MARTIPASRWSEKRDFVELATNWRVDGMNILWNYVWQGWDSYQSDVLDKVDLSEANQQLERLITQDIELNIREVMSRYEPFVIQQERYEEENMHPIRPKQTDLSFVWYQHRTSKFAIEAKVLYSDTKSGVKEYVEEINENFLKFRYAPLSSEGGMLGYLLKGDCAKAFSNIEKAISCQLNHHPDFQEREHKTSDHQRIVPPDKSYPVKFRCHHLVLQLTKNSDLNHDEKIASDGPKNIDVKN